MAVGIASLLFNIEEALNICESIKQITHLEIGIDNISECSELCKYRDTFAYGIKYLRKHRVYTKFMDKFY